MGLALTLGLGLGLSMGRGVGWGVGLGVNWGQMTERGRDTILALVEAELE